MSRAKYSDLGTAMSAKFQDYVASSAQAFIAGDRDLALNLLAKAEAYDEIITVLENAIKMGIAD